jgi:predicted nuclease of restriction endonuclease-like (RecB) superfamily
MAKRRSKSRTVPDAAEATAAASGYDALVGGIGGLLESARRQAVRAVNGILTAAYWEVGRRIVEHEQRGSARAGYGEGLLKRLAADLTARHGRGFAKSNLFQMRAFYLGWKIFQTPSGKLEARVVTGGDAPKTPMPAPSPEAVPLLAAAFPMPWSHYVRLMAVASPEARAFYEAEAVAGGWSVRQLARQIGTQLYERSRASAAPAALIRRSRPARPGDAVAVGEQIRDPYVLEFLDLADEYSESELEDALVRHLERFLLELGAGFTFVARQKRIRVGDEWYRMDLVFFHRGLRCLVIVDLKVGAFTHADAGQMALYLSYAREHMTMPGEAEPVGIVLCSDKDDAVVRYATGGINMRVFASKYLTVLPDEETLRREIQRTRKALAERTDGPGGGPPR